MVNKSSNKNLHKASKAKKDEFYTQLVDIEKELKNYKDQFRGKIVYCNCDDPYESNFFKYFASKFNALGLKKLITTSYSGSPIIGGQLTLDKIAGLKPKGKEPLKIEITEVPDVDGDGAIDIDDVKKLLEHNKNIAKTLVDGGDFRSPECIKLLKEADIVVTNPPFSLFREYIAQLVEYNKKFLILGNMNAITYKDIFKLIKENKLWSGYGFNMSMVYKTPYSNNLEANKKFVAGKGYNPNDGYVKVPAVNWYTNLDTEKRHEKFDLYRKYTPQEYPKYDNYDAIEVSKVSEIPMSYEGAMGVPITFLNKYNPEQFELLGIMNTGEKNVGIRYKGTPHGRPLVNGVEKYLRILIKAKKLKK